MKLTKDNYYSAEANLEYMGATQFKDFQKCEREALAKVMGEYQKESTKAMLVGSYVDAYFSDELDEFKEKNPQIFKKDGTLLKDFEQANEIIETIENDPMMMKFLSGQHQVIMTGKINGVKFKIKVDSLLDDFIVDQKIMSSINNLEWQQDENGGWYKADFVEVFGYDIQGAIYQEIVRQNVGKKLPFVLAVTTKEESPNKALIQIDQYYLDKALEVVKENCERFDLIKKGIIVPNGCDNCPTCRKSKMVKGIVSYETLFNKIREEEIDEQ
ncbi:MAG: PD-(D/E)XK nuclease-like domain-containing protein [Methanobrevibacter sp.]|nr:PD-(D/E)XK nuclease-like domain-containing protein [Methanobrevibacter sp.]